ncbi:MAG: SMI1/KNR4 family protein [Bacteroidota bacterium]|nr:SMI1/KNR4 family protein [Bacteroidota bacterium]
MYIENFIQQLDKLEQTRKGFRYTLGKALQVDDFKSIEEKLEISIPNKIKDFYLVANGLITNNPEFEIIAIDSWVVKSDSIHFATFDQINKIYFNISEINQAGEWTIYNLQDNYEITLTISSFWSNKIWQWIIKNKKIWANNWWLTQTI